MATRLALGISATFLLLIALACNNDGEPVSGKPMVVSTISPITSIVENIGGDRITLEGIIPEGVNSHTFEPSPSVARAMAQADLIVLNGLFLEEPSLKMAEAGKKPGALILTLADKTISQNQWVYDFAFPEGRGHPNPHLWTSPVLALKYAELVRDQLALLDPLNATYYQENYKELETRLLDLDRRIAEAIKTIPPKNRKLLTYHDSFPFFASRYGMEIIGAIQPSDFSQPSARETAALIDQVRKSGVPAVFGSAVFPSDVMEQIAKEGGARFVDQLRDDDLPGAPGDPLHNYLGLMVANVEAIVTALGGSAAALDGFDASPVFQGESGAVYPQ